MSLSGYVVEGRAHLLARIKLAFDLLLALALYLSDAPLITLLAPAIDLLLLVPYLRYVKRSPALLTFAFLALWAGLLALAPLALGAWGLALWVLFPLIPASAGFVLGRRPLLWQMALITAGVLAFGVFLLLQANVVVAFDRTDLAVLASATLASTLLVAWLMARVLQAESGSRDMLGQPGRRSTGWWAACRSTGCARNWTISSAPTTRAGSCWTWRRPARSAATT